MPSKELHSARSQTWTTRSRPGDGAHAMYLKSITIKGFKSFPDRTRLEFGPGTSVIVGPNGSGKSNVTDAVLWALGEQSPMAVRGHSMQDVIFAGVPGRQVASAATVELVLDDSDGELALGPEISIMRRLERSGEGEYRINGARCRLIDMLELLSDTGLGKEMHSVVSQGRIEAIVTSKPRERRMLIEEAAGLGKYRKRRRRAQIKLEHTQDNLSRALDVEREANLRCKPLKRQAEAAELHQRIGRQMLEIRWELAREELRARQAQLELATQLATSARARRGGIEAELEAVAVRRRAAEEALATRASHREELSRRSYAAQAAADRIGFRADAVAQAHRTVLARAQRARTELQSLTDAASAQAPDLDTAARIEALAAELEALQHDRDAERQRQIQELDARRTAAVELQAQRLESLTEAKRGREQAEAGYEQARLAVRQAERTVEAARRESARVGGELAAVNQFLRSHQSAAGGGRSLADELRVSPGYELALAAALDGRLGAVLLHDRAAAAALLERSGREGGRVLLLGAGRDGNGKASAEPCADAVALADQVNGVDEAARVARRLLQDVWVVGNLDDVSQDFPGVAVTLAGRVFSGSAGELRQVAKAGEERVLAQRNRQTRLIADSEAALQAEHRARGEVDRALALATEADMLRDQALTVHRQAVAAHDEAVELERRLGAVIQRRRNTSDEGPLADRAEQLKAQLAAERERSQRAERERAQRDERIATLTREVTRGDLLAPLVGVLEGGMRDLAAAVLERKQQFDEELAADRDLAQQGVVELRLCAQDEAAIKARLSAAVEELTDAGVGAQRGLDQVADAEQALQKLADELKLAPTPAEQAMDTARREELQAALARLARRAEQIGPVNPLAQEQYSLALAHVQELEAQRQDLESALHELEGLIRDTDRQISETFQATFNAAAAHFEALVARVFPGGHGRLSLASEPESQVAVLGGQAAEVPSQDEADSADDQHDGEELDMPGVEIEITPAGKAMKRLSLLSGGEKSMTALAFLFAVFLAKPCPFYVMDEVEAALDDLNISRFLGLLEAYSDRAQFIVVTHQKRTMEAADALYGVAMGGDGVSRVISRRLPARQAA
ncbi:MAG: chromosome segregation SMC family protein [Solirubrobacteraceae bacterium]